MAKRRTKPALSTVVAFMSDETQSSLASQMQPSTTLPLASIRPDPNQPRRLLPADLNEAVAQGSMTPLEAAQKWLERAEIDTDIPALQQNIQELKRLAQSIAQHGLINPISVREPLPDEVVPPNTTYLIVTGERRYWAHILLLNEGRTIQEGQTTTSPSQIKATITPSGITIRAHQFIENILREDINAVERARGMWALRYELSGVNHGSPLSTIAGVNRGSPDQDVPLVPWREVEEVLGISKRYRIFTIAVLKLCDEAQALVEAHHLAERTVRPIAQKLADYPDLQLKALKQLIQWQTENEAEEGPGRAIVGAVGELVDQLLIDQAKEQPEQGQMTRSVSSAPVIRFRNKVRQALDFLNRLKKTDREGLTTTLARGEFADVMVDLRNLRNQIDGILTEAGQSSMDDDEAPSNPEESVPE